MAEVILDSPSPPIVMTWEGSKDSYDNLADLAIDLEFLQEANFRPGESRPRFLDSSGFEYRILVMSLEVVLCVRVPWGYDPGDLELVAAAPSGKRLVIEHLNGRIHRALAVEQSGGGAYSACREAGAPPCDSLSGVGELAGTSMPWEEFDRLWLEAMDPTPPLSARQVVRDIAQAIKARIRTRAKDPEEP